MRRIALTAGEPAGIGPDLVIQIAQQNLPCELVVIADNNLLTARARLLKLPWHGEPYQAEAAAGCGVKIYHVPCPDIQVTGKPNPVNADYVLNTLKIAAQGCLNQEFSALVTGPVQKSVINEAGIAFSGHTEFLARLAGVDKTVMLLQTEGLRVALVTTHLPLTQVPQAITVENLSRTLEIVQRDLIRKFRVRRPKIYVCGLNPHAGEAGHLGREEIDIIIPVMETLKQQGFDLYGPLPADTIFTEKYLHAADCIVAMYHDQGLPVVKFKAFHSAVNITLGLPFIRTSVDHGTALDLAGTGSAHVGSLRYAVDTALFLSEAAHDA